MVAADFNEVERKVSSSIKEMAFEIEVEAIE